MTEKTHSANASVLHQGSNDGALVLRDLVAAAKNSLRLPNIIGERCVHSRLEVATCTGCVDSCPHGAWVLDDDQLGLDSSACDGCGLCAAACKERAIEISLDLDVQTHNDEKVALAVCDQSGVIGFSDAERVPCVHAIGLAELLELYNRDVRRLLFSCGDCSSCERGSSPDLLSTVESLNDVLSDRCLAPIALVAIPSQHWSGATLAISRTTDRGDTCSRRDFFCHVAEALTDFPNDSDQYRGALANPPSRLLPRRTAGNLTFFVPRIDATTCKGCDACARVCAYGAITLSKNNDAYNIDAESCSGCGLCRDICNANAIDISPWSRQRVGRIDLERYRCAGCGAPFHRIRNPLPSSDVLCDICANTEHRKKLYQVMD